MKKTNEPQRNQASWPTLQRWWGAAPGLNRSQSLWLGRLYCLPQSMIPLPLQLVGIHRSPKFLFDTCMLYYAFDFEWPTVQMTRNMNRHRLCHLTSVGKFFLWVLHTAQMDFKFMNFKKNWDHRPKLPCPAAGRWRGLSYMGIELSLTFFCCCWVVGINPSIPGML